MNNNNNKKIKVLSLFDGISAGRVALERAGFEVEKYYASEIDKFAISVTMKNYPDTIQIGDVTKVKVEDYKDVDIVMGGSPCTGFSFAGKQLNFKDKQSKLFFEFVRILKEVKPKYFLLENVRMKQEYQDVISNLLGVKPININSKLVSAQLRNRFYWTNIPNIEQPKDKGIVLMDILENGWTDREKARCLLESDSRPLKNKENMVHRFFNTGFTTVVFRDKELSDYAKSRVKERLNGKKGVVYNWFNDRVSDEKSNTLLANSGGWSGKSTNLVIVDDDIRYFTQTELEKLQTLPVGYTSCLDRNKSAGVIGNSWTVDVLAHIFKNIK